MSSRYLAPTVDFVFKKLFGSQAHKNIVIDFLNNILERPEGHLIVDVDFNDTFNQKENDDAKMSIVDVRCTDQAKNIFIVEMQANEQLDFCQRCQYYAAFTLSRQLAKTSKYENVSPVIMVSVLCFNLFPDHDRYLTHHLITDQSDKKSYLNHLEFHFIELPKFKKTEAQLDNDIDRWIFFMNHASEYYKKPDLIAKKNQALKDAFEVVDQVNWDMNDLINYERYIDALRCRASEYDTAMIRGMERGMEQGIEKGIEQGIEKGIEKGIEQGEKKAKLNIAQKLFAKGISLEDISHSVDLSEDELRELLKK